MPGSWKSIPSSSVAKRTSNPIRAIVDGMKLTPNPEKPMIALSIGDPTLFGNFVVPESAITEIKKILDEKQHNGYPPAHGYESARRAIAEYYRTPEAPLVASDVVIASGASGAIEIAITCLADPGQNILIPRPGFSLYETIADARGIEVRHYDLQPDKEWEIDLDSVKKLADSKTAFLLINNPSNPCGSNYSVKHLQEILQVADELHLPIISDEIYGEMVFEGNVFTPIASLSKTVPILTIGGLAKRFMVPGWRVGWILIHDRQDLFKDEVQEGLQKLSQLVLGANSVIQAAIPHLLLKTDPAYHQQNLRSLQEHALFVAQKLSAVKGLKPVVPQGAMYIMVAIDVSAFNDIADDADFCQKLVQEQSVFCLPGQCFKYKNFFRIVFTNPKDKLLEACDRIAQFCKDHRKAGN